MCATQREADVGQQGTRTAGPLGSRGLCCSDDSAPSLGQMPGTMTASARLRRSIPGAQQLPRSPSENSLNDPGRWRRAGEDLLGRGRSGPWCRLAQTHLRRPPAPPRPSQAPVVQGGSLRQGWAGPRRPKSHVSPTYKGLLWRQQQGSGLCPPTEPQERGHPLGKPRAPATILVTTQTSGASKPNTTP